LGKKSQLRVVCTLSGSEANLIIPLLSTSFNLFN